MKKKQNQKRSKFIKEAKLLQEEGYSPPILKFSQIQMEGSIAAGSAKVRPDQPQEEWEDKKEEGTLDW
ncbi:hypothetical protein GNY06_02745 [Elizabethkingia argentiflava]|uniref:Uncharacterized protein n=1 Tax=Elizabethkingia argenteiflava TaxID=2681556 RepID=A0A845PTI5_9FLAO|nr:hypothetical protein [Elizabethkingia argenteiflava]NAW50351.1 hypothetical protein [Elizabethkingia argenteiflava]